VGAQGGPRSQALYLHAIAAASVVHVAAPHCTGVHGGLLFVTALVHDLGLQLMLILEPASSEALVDKFGHNAMLARAERVHFGFDHAQLGAEGLRQWGLPEPVAELVARHHEPVAKKQRSRALLHIADDVAGAILRGDTEEDIARIASEHVLAGPLGVDAAQWASIVEAVPEVMSELTM